MAELDALAGPHEIQGVLPGIVSPAQSLDPDRAFGTRADIPGPLEDEVVFETLGLPLGHGPGKKQRGAAWRIAFGRVMKFKNLWVKILPQTPSGFPGEPAQYVDRDRKVRRVDHRDALGQGFDFFELSIRAPRGSCHVGDARCGGGA